MSRASNEKRSIFLTLFREKQKPIRIATILGVTRQTITNWIRSIKKSGEGEIMINKRALVTIKAGSKFDLEALRIEFDNNPFGFNHEIGAKFGMSKTVVQRYRQKFGYSRKVAKKSYKEADPELKKNSKRIYQYIKN